MIKGTLELQSCSVAVTASSIVLTVASVEGKTYTVTMPFGMGVTLGQEIALGTRTFRGGRDVAAAPASVNVDPRQGGAVGDLAAHTLQISQRSEELCASARDCRAQLQENRAQLRENRALFQENRAQFQAELQRFRTAYQRGFAAVNAPASS